ncbi:MULTISPECIES: cytidine deaminase [Modicisalibacter]|uniref:cytidine deaminase n=1 Tax=Modicisalibacter TaxID=574347 RepID=UPI00100A648E|nr:MULTISPECIES: cytidine deaminase [Halomonadaceae]MBZ9557700.1 cytidine deaminase [Modicisalibacter sp. R2A 31.J]MBZ9573636.1 cytidine deaminase [Modicisalibacter sp. MOD 31.J]
MSPIDPAIVERLLAVRDHAYVAYSAHPVGALIETPSGSRYAGCNVEIANYKGLCAEAGAIAAMVAAGERDIATLYVIGPGAHRCTPCGDCRQRIREFASPTTRIHVLDADGQCLKSYSMEALLPDSFGPENLGKPSPMGG